MAKSLVLVAYFISSSLFCIGQQMPILNLVEKADNAYEQFGYLSASEYYLKALAIDSTDLRLIERIGMCYVKLNEPVKAELWLKKVESLSDSISQDLKLILADQLAQNKKYDEARAYLESLDQLPLVQSRLQGSSNYEQFVNAAGRYLIVPLPFNSDEADFGVMYYENGIAFVTSRNKRKWVKNDFNWDKSAFLDFYYYNPSDTTKTLKKVTSLNSSYHEGPGQVYHNGRKITFTRTNTTQFNVKRDKEGVSNLQLYFADRGKKGEDWINIRKFEHNSDAYSLGHPTISQDERVLIFASNKPGGYGGTDLYYATAQTDDKWSEPVNLGNTINTSADEFFPHLKGNMLFFASDGWPGLGGLDIFSIIMQDSIAAGLPVNMGAPINGSRDDFGLIVSDNFRSGYFSSSREESDNIYRFDANFISLSGLVKNLDSSISIDSANVVIMTNAGTQELGGVTNGDGQYEFETTLNGEFVLSAQKKGWVMANSLTINIETMTGGGSLDDLFIYQPKIRFEFFDKSDSSTIEDVELLLTTFDSIIDVPNRDLSYTVIAGSEYILKTVTNKYYARRDTFLIAANAPEFKTLRIPLRKIVQGESIRLENVYYDLNSASLRPESQEELNKLLGFMNDNPGIVVELSAHTDSQGFAPYNKRLSQKRVESVTKYLTENGIDKQRLVSKGYGESKLVNNCSDGVKCSAEQHQENRRTEITILGD
ncbi:MAG: outer membrane protein OmpA-like peptidoglycan-associated protein [Paraglaciecola sp.]|jgi:outer membrane protein OmpA-like peptidoglycan-associated protein/tetratricopeptide (TPR) repeat protein